MIWTFQRIILLPVEKFVEILGHKGILTKTLINIIQKLDSVKIRKILPDGNTILLSPFGRGDMSVMDDIYYKNVYDFFKPKNGSTIIDVGAHIGLYSLKVAKKVEKNGIIIAIEPHPRNYILLCKNININGYGRIIPLEIALSDIEGTTKLFVEPASYISHSTIFCRSGEWIKVKATTLDGITEKFNLKQIDLIKIDVEGAELAVLKGAEKTLEMAERLIIAAYHTPMEAEEIKRYLLFKNFKVVRYKNGILFCTKNIDQRL